MEPTMKRFQTFAAVIVTLLFATARGQAQSGLTGQWQGTTNSGSQVVLDLTAKDTTLTGTLTRDDVASKITDGKVDKKGFTFKATLGDQVEVFVGEISGAEIKVWLERQGPERAIAFKRVKK
jgi:hypothetical protein